MIRIIAILISVGALSIILYVLLNNRQKAWTEMSPEEKNRKKLALTGSFLVLIAGVLTAIFTGKKK